MLRLDYSDLWDLPPWGTGAAHSVSYDSAQEDAVERLRQVVEEVTGQSIERPSKKIGFY